MVDNIIFVIQQTTPDDTTTRPKNKASKQIFLAKPY